MLEGLTQCGWMCCPGWGLGTEVFGCLWRELEWGTREVALEDLLSELEGDPGDVQDKNLPSTSHSPCPLPSGSPFAHQTDCAPTKVSRDKLIVHMVAYF